MTRSTSSVFSINVLLIFDMDDLTGALFLNTTYFYALSFAFPAASKISVLNLLKDPF